MRNHVDKQLVASTVPCFVWKATLGSCYWIQGAAASHSGRKALGKRGLHLSAQWEMREKSTPQKRTRRKLWAQLWKTPLLSVECALKELQHKVSVSRSNSQRKWGAISKTPTANQNVLHTFTVNSAQTESNSHDCVTRTGKIMLDGLLKVKNNLCNWKR